MKKLITLFASLITIVAVGQNPQGVIGVSDFVAHDGVNPEEIEILSVMFTTFFKPTGLRIMERAQIDRVITEQNMQRSKLTDGDMVQVGRLLNLDLIVLGNVKKVNGEYSVDARVVSVQSGEIVTSDYVNWQNGMSEREAMQKLGRRMSNLLNAIDLTTIINAKNQVRLVHNSWYVYPKDLGEFAIPPLEAIANINKVSQ